jgi:hypothetical protein
MLESQPPQTPGLRVGFSLLALILLVDALLLVLLIQLPVTFFTFLCGLLLLLSIPALLIVVYWIIALREARYDVEGGALIIQWGRLRQVVPLKAIAAIVPGEESGGIVHFQGLRWPGLRVGRGAVALEEGERATRFFATRELNEQLLIVTEARVYAISPSDREIFRDSLVALLRTTLPRTPAVEATDLDFWRWALWRDRAAWLLLGAAAGLNLLLFALLSTVYGRLGLTVPLDVGAGGEVIRSGSPAGLFVIPLAGLLTWVVNGGLGLSFYLSERNRPVAYIIWGATVAIQVAAWIAALGLLTFE